MLGIQRQRLAHWVALAQRELVTTETGFEITPRWDGHGYRVTLGETITVELDGAFEFSSPSLDAVERVLILRLGAEARIREFAPVLLPSHPGDLVRGFQVNEDPNDPTIWVMLRDGVEVARVRRGTDDYSPAVEFSQIADVSPWVLRDSLLDPQGLPLFEVPPPPAEAAEPLVVSAGTTHLRPDHCPGARATPTEQLAVGNWERLVRCVRCGALYVVHDGGMGFTFEAIDIEQARTRFAGVDL